MYAVIDGIFGFRATIKGVKLEPDFPKQWNNCSIEIAYSDAKYIVSFSRVGNGKNIISTKVNGENYTGVYLPCEANCTYLVEVQIGS